MIDWVLIRIDRAKWNVLSDESRCENSLSEMDGWCRSCFRIGNRFPWILRFPYFSRSAHLIFRFGTKLGGKQSSRRSWILCSLLPKFFVIKRRKYRNP